MTQNDKQEVYDSLFLSIGLKPRPLGPGSKEHKNILNLIHNRYLPKLKNKLSKTKLAAKIVRSAGLVWDRYCQSRGETITTEGLKRVYAAVSILSAQQPGKWPVRQKKRGRFGVPFVPQSGGPPRGPGNRSFEVDLDRIEKASREHMKIVNRLASILESQGLSPLGPQHGEDPEFDLGWNCSAGIVVAEIKSANRKNIRQQARLGLGQIIEYRARLQALHKKKIHAVIVLGCEPTEASINAGKSVDVQIVSIRNAGNKLKGRLK